MLGFSEQVYDFVFSILFLKKIALWVKMMHDRLNICELFKGIVFCLICCIFSEAFPVGAQQSEGNGTLYTTCNLWERRGNIDCINFKVGNIIPAGTPVEHVRIDNGDLGGGGAGFAPDPFANDITVIAFSTLPDKRDYKIFFYQKWHPGKNIEDYRKMLFSESSDKELFSGMDEQVVLAVKLGKIIEGMPKEAVLLSYGFPPEHQTPNLSSSRWMYWMNKFKKKVVCFDANNLATPCNSVGNEL